MTASVIDGERTDGTGPLPPPRTGLRRSFVFLLVLVVVMPVMLLVSRGGDETWRIVSTSAGLRERGVIYVKDARAFVVHTEDGPVGLSAVSTHLGWEPVAYCRSSSTFVEFAHGSTWTRLGHYLDGPAPRGMDRVAIRLNRDVVEINPDVMTPGPPRGAGSPFEPSGPLCSFETRAAGASGFLRPDPPVD